MKRLISILLVLFAVLPLVGCQGSEANVIDISTPEPAATGAPTAEATEAPTAVPTEEATEVPTDAPATEAPTDIPATPAPTETGGLEPDYTVFDDAAFLGNSVMDGMYLYGIITHGDFFTKTSLNVNTVMTEPLDKESERPIIDELNDGTYLKVILYFGTNELGWPSYPTFIERYAAVIDAVWQRQPNAKIFVCAVLPVGKAKNDKNENGINNRNVARMNEAIEEMCAEKGVFFIDAPEEMYDGDGCLPGDASSDGVHLNTKYYRIWAEKICLDVMKNS